MIKIDDFNEEDLIWLYSKTPEEERISNKMYKFERKYFSENSFNHLRKEFIKSKNKTHEYIPGLFDDLFGDKGLSFSKNEWTIKLVNTKESLYGWRGECDSTYNLIKIEESYKDDDGILIHEMIHAYEFMLEKYPS